MTIRRSPNAASVLKLAAVAAVLVAAATVASCSRRSDAEGERALQPPPPPAAAKPVPEAAPATPANATGNNVVATPQSINDGAFSPDYAPPQPATAPSSAPPSPNTPQQR
jgi:hypothetical protein